MAKLRINGDSSGYVDLEAPNAASSSTLDLDQVPQKNVANTFSAVNKFTDSVAIGGTHSPVNNLDVRSTGQAIVRVDGVGLYYNGIKIRNNYSSVQSDWNVGAAGGTSGWGSANGTFIVRDDTTNSTGLEIEQGAGSNTAALHINSSGYVTTPSQPSFCAFMSQSNPTITSNPTKIPYTSTRWNTGNNFDTTNNRFVAPVAGKYLFQINHNVYNLSDDQYFRTRPYLNGSPYAVLGYMRARGGGDHTVNDSILMDLNANDFVEVYTSSNDTSYSLSAGVDWNSFSGFLVG